MLAKGKDTDFKIFFKKQLKKSVKIGQVPTSCEISDRLPFPFFISSMSYGTNDQFSSAKLFPYQLFFETALYCGVLQFLLTIRVDIKPVRQKGSEFCLSSRVRINGEVN